MKNFTDKFTDFIGHSILKDGVKVADVLNVTNASTDYSTYGNKNIMQLRGTQGNIIATKDYTGGSFVKLFKKELKANV